MENIGVGMPFSELGQTKVYPSFPGLPEERYPVGFMDLLGVHQGISRYALIHNNPNTHLPVTPNSSSISSASSDAVTGEEKKRDEEKYEEEEEEEEQQHKRNKR